MKRIICHLAGSVSASHCSGGDPASEGKGVPSKDIGQGKWTPLDCTMYPEEGKRNRGEMNEGKLGELLYDSQ